MPEAIYGFTGVKIQGLTVYQHPHIITFDIDPKANLMNPTRSRNISRRASLRS
jgi:hypothetical protein